MSLLSKCARLNLFGLCLLISISANASASDLSQIIAAHQLYKTKIKSMSAEVVETPSIDKLHPGSPMQRTFKVAWAFKGAKNVTNRDVSDPKMGSAIITELWDGKRTTNFDDITQPDGKVISYGTVKSEVNGVNASPYSFGYYHDGLRLGDMLALGNSKVDGTDTDPTFGPLIIVACTPPHAEEGETCRFWFAPKLGYLCVRQEDITAVPNHNMSNSLMWETTKVKNLNGIWLATEGSIAFSHLDGAVKTINYASIVQFQDVHLNDVPDSVFALHTSTGSHIDDVDTKQRHILLADGTWKRIKSPLEAHNNSDDAPDAPPINPATWFFVASGVCVLAVIGLRFFQRKQAA